MVLYTCGMKKHGATTPLIKHPCGVAARALDDANHPYELRVVGGFKNLPWTRRGKRAEIRRLTGQDDVPILRLDDGTTVVGSGRIVAWARGDG